MRGDSGARGAILACVQESTEIPALVGVAVPNLAFVYVNYNDHAFAKVSRPHARCNHAGYSNALSYAVPCGWVLQVTLDAVSLKYLSANLKPEVVTSPLLRQTVWRDLYDMVRDAKLPAPEYLRIVRELIPFETDIELLTSVSNTSTVRCCCCARHRVVGKLCVVVGVLCAARADCVRA